MFDMYTTIFTWEILANIERVIGILSGKCHLHLTRLGETSLPPNATNHMLSSVIIL